MAKQYVAPEAEIVEVDANDGNRYSLPYGIAKGLGLDTTGMKPREVWEMLDGYGYNPKNTYNKLKQKSQVSIQQGEIIQVIPIKNDYLRKAMQVNKVDYVPVRSLTQKLDEQEIIDTLYKYKKIKAIKVIGMVTYEELKKEMRLSDFYKVEPSDKIWWISAIDYVGYFLFSFDKKVIYNFFAEYEELTEEQKEIFRQENPLLVAGRE